MAARTRTTLREWSKQDVRELKTLARTTPARVIARKLKRTEGAVRQKAFSLGTSFSGPRRSRRK
jgi:hypothetical protein